MASKRFWAELKSSEFAALDPNSTLAVLPVAATEQHGPHLPVMTDTAIMDGMIETVLARLPDDLRVLFLPVQTIGKSNEHLRSPGTITHSAENLIRGWFEMGEGVHRAGLRQARHRQFARRQYRRHRHRRASCACGSACWSPPPNGAGQPAGGALFTVRCHPRHPRRRHRDLADAAVPARSRRHGAKPGFFRPRPPRWSRDTRICGRRASTASVGSRKTSTPTAPSATPRRDRGEGRLTAEHQAEASCIAARRGALSLDELA
jgi:hypothetical protein